MTTDNAMTNNLNGVVFQAAPPNTGSQRCDSCGGWIVGITSYIKDGKRYCPNCWRCVEEKMTGKPLDDFEMDLSHIDSTGGGDDGMESKSWRSRGA